MRTNLQFKRLSVLCGIILLSSFIVFLNVQLPYFTSFESDANNGQPAGWTFVNSTRSTTSPYSNVAVSKY